MTSRPPTPPSTQSGTTSTGVPPAVLVAVLLGVAAQCWLCWRMRRFLTDDAWISVRYAENLASGAGPVWNPGGPRVEGYSNPLLVGVEALVAAAGGSAVVAARTLGVACALACVVAVGTRGRGVVGDTAAGTAALLTGACAPLALWAVGGLETLPVALALTVALLELARPDGGRPVVAGVALAVLPWLRPEGLVVAAAVVAAGELAGLLRRGRRARTVRRLAWLAGLPLLSQAALEAVRLAVYGHLLPNSVLYKSGTGEVLGVLSKFVAQAWPVLLLAGAGLVVARGRQWLLAVPAVVYGLGSIGTLDSANAWSRFFLPVWPPVALLAGLAVAAVAAAVTAVLRRREPGGTRQPAAGGLLLGAAAAVALLLAPPAAAATVERWQERYDACRTGAREDMAAWLRASPPGTTFAVADAGLVPARAGGRTAVDVLLLNDPLIQRTGPLPYDVRAELVHARRPDTLVVTSRHPDRVDPLYATDRALLDHPRGRAYAVAHVARGEGPSCRYHLVALSRDASR